MKISLTKLGMIATGMIVIGAGISLVAFLGGAKTNISFIGGEVILSDPLHRMDVPITSSNNESYEGHKVIKENIQKVEKIDVDVETLDVYLEQGENYALDINYKPSTNVFYEVKNGKLTIKQQDHIEWSMFKQEGKRGEVIIYLPREAFLEEVDIDMGFGKSDILDIKVGKLDLECGMGSVNLENVSVQKGKVEGGMGNITATGLVSEGLKMNMGMGMGKVEIEGKLQGITDIEGGMGELSLNLVGREEDYNYDISKGMGSITINGSRHNGFEDVKINNQAKNEMMIEGGMGSIKVNTME